MTISFRILFFTSLCFSLLSCGNAEEVSKKMNNCSTKNIVSTLKYDDKDQEFDLEYTYANYNKTYKTFRVLFLTYPKSEDKDYGKKGAGQQRLVVTILNPLDGEFKPGVYTFKGDENGFNKAAVQVETESGTKACNIQGIKETGSIEILDISEATICGNFNLSGTNFHAAGEFNAKHESVK